MRFLFFIFCSFLFCLNAFTQDTAAYTQQEVIYGRKDGTALTMLVLTPAKSNNRGIVNTVSGNWVSSFSRTERWITVAQPYLKRGYTVFNVVHGSQPRYAIADATADIKRAVQFIRFNAKAYNINPDYIGITGASSGGHLSLLAGLADNAGNPDAKDPVEKLSGKVQAVACFFPPTDFLNWGITGVNPVQQKAFLQMMGVLGAFTFTRFDSAKKIYAEITDTAKIMALAKALSPAQLVTADDAPVFIWHGDADNVVPLQQSEVLKKKMEAANIPFVLKIKPGGRHGWESMSKEEEDFADWFDKYLKVKK